MKHLIAIASLTLLTACGGLNQFSAISPSSPDSSTNLASQVLTNPAPMSGYRVHFDSLVAAELVTSNIAFDPPAGQPCPANGCFLTESYIRIEGSGTATYFAPGITPVEHSPIDFTLTIDPSLPGAQDLLAAAQSALAAHQSLDLSGQSTNGPGYGSGGAISVGGLIPTDPATGNATMGTITINEIDSIN